MACWCSGDCPNIKLPRRLLAEKKPREAEMRLRRALIDAPRCVAANLALGTLLVETHRANFALTHFVRARQSGGATPETMFKIGVCQRQSGDVAGAIATFGELVEIDGKNPQAWAALISAYEADGDLDQAEEMIGRARSQFTLTGDLRRTAAVVIAARKRFSEAIELLAGNPSPIELLDRGRYKEKIGDFDGAWSDWMAGKQILAKAGQVYDENKMRASVARLREIARPERQKWIGQADRVPAPAPVFVCGFPRSGTTMVEAALSAHSKIAAGDELMMLSECIQLLPMITRAGVPYPMALMATAAGENDNRMALNVLQKFYLEKSRAKIGDRLAGASYFTDKMCLNELHLPLIAALLPGAHVRRVVRHPLDVIVSCLSHYLPAGGFFASSPASCATHFALVDSLVELYEHDAADRFTTVQYENFVRDHRAAIDAILPTDLAPEEACYNFHENPWHSRTISYRQVHQPLYDSSVGRWRNFRKQLESVLQIVAPAMERWAYDA